MGRKLFCELHPVCYEISRTKEIARRHMRDFLRRLAGREKIAAARVQDELPNIVKSHTSVLVRRLHGVDMALQENKVTNIMLACGRISGIVIEPGEVFSFWKTVGRPTYRKGYKDGLVIARGGFVSGVGGGLCQMANMIHWLVLNSPLEVTELHHHSDALFPDERRRVPFGTGTSVSYNYIDYRFRNPTDQRVQILVWCENGELCGELRSEAPFPYRYKLMEENHHFRLEEGRYYRISQVYRSVIDRADGREAAKELILDNHSAVMYDYSLIPKEQIRNDDGQTDAGSTADG